MEGPGKLAFKPPRLANIDLQNMGLQTFLLQAPSG
jgi:hypothetical protein